ncbi:MAG: DUF6048 family protein [Bacteroidales bacterium]|nr:DUF6048 family protein [Bacteroidales bacterium]
MDMLKYIFSITILLITFSFSYGQDEENYVPVKEKIPLELKGLKLGLNVGRFSDYLFKPERISYEASFDFNLSDKYYGIFEAGYSEIKIKKDNYHYLSEGYFYKLGMDYNMLKKQPSDYLGMGIRLAWADFSHSASDLILEPDHWPIYSTSVDSKSYKTYWLEASFGIKGEIFKNVYLGWSGLVRVRISGDEDLNFQPYDIPGFGTGEKTITLGANYYIFYQIPFNRK